jgi:hypothetical protein
MLHTKFRFIWESGFRGEDFLEINQSETRMACGPDPLRNMAVLGNSCFYWSISKTAFPLKPLGQMI